MTAFSKFNLNSNILKSISYAEPTPIQAAAIPIIQAGKDLLALAPTGTGKSAAFILPALQTFCVEKPGNKTRILILTPTRELAQQITQSAQKYAKFLPVKIISLVGGMSYRQQLKDLSREKDIIVATPGRLLDHMKNNHVNLSHIQMLVLDEADRMLDMGFVDAVKTIAAATPKNRQTLLFSATDNPKLNKIISQLLKKPEKVDLSPKNLAPSEIKQEIYSVDSAKQKMKLLSQFISEKNIFKAIIFSRTKINADRLAEQLRDQGHLAGALHSDLRQNQRNRTIADFTSGKIQFLVATDIAARGINISDISHVINYDFPQYAEDYVHRIGRTGRAGQSGIAISFALHSDRPFLQRVERYLGQRLKITTHGKPDTNPNTPIANENAKIAVQDERQPYRDDRRKVNSRRPAKRRVARSASQKNPSFRETSSRENSTSDSRRSNRENSNSNSRHSHRENSNSDSRHPKPNRFKSRRKDWVR